MTGRVEVRAPCRLHFGMFGFGQPEGRQFGGVGVMLDSPAVELRFSPANEFAVQGKLAQRVKHFVELALRAWNIAELPNCCIDVQSPPDHTGLGVGTQLGLATATGLRRFLELPELPVVELAASVGRGARSAIGTYGFQQGGLIIDAGKLPGDTLGKLATRVVLPEEWRFVLARAADASGLAGDREVDAFAQLPPVPTHVSTELMRIVESDMLPAADASDCDAFGEAVFQFGRKAGECFAAVQGGPYASPETARLIESIRDRGVRGVGQSSWGPTVFAIVPNEAEASSLAQWLARDAPVRFAATVSAPNNRGAQITLS
jgi:beta-ribofuranosylaminobenzene 5'-phosphate synthase